MAARASMSDFESERWIEPPSFGSAADAYDAARPDYPDALYDLMSSRMGGLGGRVVLDAGAGTGIASRQLLARGANLVAVDVGNEMLARAIRREPVLRCMVADAAALPITTGAFESLCFAQSWHSVNQATGAEEAARILRPRGWWAAWWNHPWADGERWFDEYYTLLEERCAGVSREQREIKRFAQAITEVAAFDDPRHDVIEWTRSVPVGSWIIDLTSHSYIIALSEPERIGLLGEIDALLHGWFPSGLMTVPYETRLLMAERL